MIEPVRIHALTGGAPLPDKVREALSDLGEIRESASVDALTTDERAGATLFVVRQEAWETDGRDIRILAERPAPLLLLHTVENDIPPGLGEFDDVAPLRAPAEVVRRAGILLEFREARDRAERLGVTEEDLRTELSRYGLDPGLAGPRGLRPPGRVLLKHLVDVDAVDRQQMSICRLMGTSYGTFLYSPRPHGLTGANGEETAPTGALSPYCAYLSTQGGHCLNSEHDAARRALLRGRPVETTCSGRVQIWSAPVNLSFGGSTYPLFAASVAVGGVPPAEEIGEVGERYGVNEEILDQMAQESRFWVLNPDKTDEIRGTFGNLAETISREVSHKYGTAWQIFRSLLTEVEIRNSREVIAESHQALEETNRQLVAKNEEIYEVTHAITHDLRKPLASLKATIGILRRGSLGPIADTQVEAVDTAWEAISYMNQLVNDLLEAARLDAGRKVLEIEEVPLCEVVDRIRRRLRLLLKENGITLEIGDLPAAIHADESGLEKILMNLVGNSASYIGDGEKRITIRGESREDRAAITVEDTGIGIPEDNLALVCEKFRRGQNVAGIRGTGLGLAIVKGLVDAHGGELVIESRLGEGTKVTFLLPAVPAHEPSEVTSLG